MKISSKLLFGFVLILAGCSSPVTNSATPLAAVPSRPAGVLVESFAAAPGIVQLDSSPGAIVQRQAAGLTPLAAEQKDVADVQAAISETLIHDIQAMGMQASVMASGAAPGPGDLVVTGQITAIQEGSRARRVVVGFGAGKSAVQAQAQLLRGAAGSALYVLQSYSLSADSGHMPGLGVGAAAGSAKSAATAVSGAAHTEGEVERSQVGQHGASIANQLAGDLQTYFTRQGWIAEAQ